MLLARPTARAAGARQTTRPAPPAHHGPARMAPRGPRAAPAAAAPAAAAEAADAQPAPPAEPATDAEAAAPLPERRRSRRGDRGESSSSSSSGRREQQGGVRVVRVSSRADGWRLGGVVCAMLAEGGGTVALSCVGGEATLIALRTLTAAQRRLDRYGPEGKCVAFQVQRRRVPARPRGGGGEPRPQEGEQQQGGEQRSDTLSTLTLFVRLEDKAAWPEETWTAAAQRLPPRDQRRDDDGGGLVPMVIRTDRLLAPGREQERVVAHALRSGRAATPAQFVLSGSRARAAEAARLLMGLLSAARYQATSSEEEPFDLLFAVSSAGYTLPPRDAADGDGDGDASSSGSGSDAEAEQQEQQEQEQEQQQEQGGEAAPRAEDEQGAGGDEDGAAADERLRTRMRYVVTSRRCEPRPARGGQPRGGGAASGARPGVRPGYVEVPEEEWSQLKEQLEVVPHLTEQLQIMTRQHEQLLSLLAAQQASEQQGDAEPQEAAPA